MGLEASSCVRRFRWWGTDADGRWGCFVRGRLITDRFAPPSATAPALTAGVKEDGTADCPPGTQK